MGGLSNLATLGLNIALQQQAQRRRAARIAREEKAQRQELVARLAEQQRRTNELLREQLARARARAGAAGVASGASFDALLRGLQQQADASKGAAEAEFAADLNRLRERVTLAHRRNLLETGDALVESFAGGLRRFSGFRRDLLG
jgi:hypothetical protein